MIDKQYLLVDGHSIIFHWPDFRRLHSRNATKARSELIALLGSLHNSSHWLVTLVFDGKSGPVPATEPGQMAVIYSCEGQTADSIIERLVGQVADASHVTVVTADEAERVTVEAHGAFVQSPEWLAGEIERTSRDMKNTLATIHKRAKW